MKKLLAIISLLVLTSLPMTSEPWGGAAITITAGTAIRLAKNRTMASSIFFQMATGGTGRGYVLFAPSGVTCANGGAGTTKIAELSPATTTAPGGSVTIPLNVDPQNPQVDVSLYCVDGSNNGDVMNVSWNIRN